MGKRPRALCTSFKCTGKHIVSYAQASEKSVSLSTIICPDCGSGLEWRKAKEKFAKSHRKNRNRDYSMNS